MAERKYATYEIEESLIQKGHKAIIGVDEVGRGPGAGPVTAGAVWIPPDNLPRLMAKIKDSKTLSEKRREEMYELIASTCLWAVASVSSEVIDQINILEATKMAMRTALDRLVRSNKGQFIYFDCVLIDGTVVLDNLDVEQRQIIKGDQKSISIAAASIMAKVTRDEEMKMLHWIYPQYDFINNKGYLVPKHLEALQTYGPCEYHRMSFKRVGDNG